MRFGARARIGLGFAVSAVCLWLAVQQAPIAEVGAALGQVSYWWLVPSMLFSVLGRWARGCRWRLMLDARGTRAEYFWAHAIGSLLTCILPLRAGEVGRTLVINRRVGIPIVQVATSAVLERAIDVAVMVGLLAALLLVMDVPWALATAGLALAVTLAVTGVGLVILLLFGRRQTDLVHRLAACLPDRLARFTIESWTHVLDGIEPLARPHLVLPGVAWSLVVWAAAIVSMWLTIEAVVPGAGPIEATFAIVAISFGTAVPSSPGFLGVYQLVGQQALATPFPDRYTPASALAIALINHLMYLGSSVTLGLVGLGRLGLSLRDTRPTVQPEPAPGA